MKIIIAAGTGFLGRNLEKYCTGKGHQVHILTRNPKRKNEIYWDAKTLGAWKDLLENADVLINLTRKIKRKYILQGLTVQKYFSRLWISVPINPDCG
ncbi:NAD-dependent epimerase/dehydratase family protein [Chryseobacterium sp. Leaf201]|uniref:NAD-dependent epimerase/dehydratase family protein n=1 Tax=Chryseobacterium sp. Leaf201 TaxID=1735672 RepID=UPI000A543FF4|nr:NAD-dependent epimerase/dehydratase family protein [Chryseobacterium sp. Leaf201]